MDNTKMGDTFIFSLAEILGKLGKFASSYGIFEKKNSIGWKEFNTKFWVGCFELKTIQQGR